MLKQLGLKKQVTLMETKRQQWRLPNEHIKILIFLGLIRKVIKSTTRAIKEKQQKQNSQLSILHKYSSSSVNSFDFIAPVNKNMEQIKITREAFVQLKKQILLFLRDIRITVQKERIQRIKKSECAMFNQNNEEPNVILMKKTCPEIKDESFFSSTPPQKIVFTEIVDLNNSVYDKECLSTKMRCTVKKIGRGKQNSLDKKFVINGKMFEERMKNQSMTFQKLNKTLAGFCQIADQSTASRGYLGLFQLFLRSIFEAKDCAAGKLNSISRQKQDTKQRIYFLINSLLNLSKTIFFMCKQIASSSNKEIHKKIEDSEQNLQSVLIGGEEEPEFYQKKKDKQKQDIVLTFIKRMNLMIQVTKLMMSISAMGQKFKNKDKSISKILVKLSEFRYIVRYLSTEVNNIKQNNKSCDNLKSASRARFTQTTGNFYELKWRKIYDRKFGRVQTSHGFVTMRK